ncbi:MAG TPA: EscU/YscU/HrcU family type III secretion system export apparatus switch protein, partial [Candidatus Angelobacter sp.]|nr:EscU/YscU/HrcU family type III secretion system export apparatus switch protein [Candidatus Angelobacter sp.]
MADSNKTEQPTGKRLLKARGEGQYATSREIIAAANFIVFLGILGAWFPTWMDGMKQMLRQALEGAFRVDLTVTTFPRIAGVLLNRAFLPLSILAGLTTLTTVAVNLAVTKMGFSLKKLMPDFSRLNPAGKIKNLATQGPAAVGQAAAMLIIFSGTIYLIAKQNAEVFLSLPFASLDISL